MTKPRSKWWRWCASLAICTGLLLSAVAGLNLAVDPYQIYHPVLGGRPLYNIQLQRFQVPGLARTMSYEIAIVGTSILQNIPNSTVERLCGRSAVNLSIAGASVYEEARTLELAIRHPGTTRVIATLDYNSFSGGGFAPVVGVDSPFPEYLYDDSVFNKLPYLLSFDSLRASYRTLYARPLAGETSDSNWPWKFPASMKFGAMYVVNGIDPTAINRTFRMTNLSFESMKATFEANLSTILSMSGDVRIHLVFPPYSILAWHDYRQRGQISTYFAFKKWLVAYVTRFANVDVVDYQDRADIITNLDLYADIYHFNENIAEQVVRSACTGDAVLEGKDVESRTHRLLELIQSTDPVRIVEHASAGSSVAER